MRAETDFGQRAEKQNTAISYNKEKNLTELKHNSI